MAFNCILVDIILEATKFELFKNEAVHYVKKHSFANRAISAWNSLPDEFACCKTVNNFKSKLRTNNISLFLKGHAFV